jgi:adenine-specific DNA-methyltransferase
MPWQQERKGFWWKAEVPFSDIGRDDVAALGLGIVAWHKELAPAGESTVVFRDNGFADDVSKTNLTAILHQSGLTNVRSL